jgi:PLP dependent protein
LKSKLLQLNKRIDDAATACSRPKNSIRLVAVSKTIEAERVREAIEAGVTILGENYIQEARIKIEQLSACPVKWHFIGHLQSNKAKYAVRLFDLIHSDDSLKLARELHKEAGKIGKCQKILVQVNIAAEASKSGIDVASAQRLVENISVLENLSIQGLMTIPPVFNQPAKVQPYFRELFDLRERITRTAPSQVSMQELSMGMTGDFEVAIAEGATLVRIGTAIFGPRG